jgi:hypothetical protein
MLLHKLPLTLAGGLPDTANAHRRALQAAPEPPLRVNQGVGAAVAGQREHRPP